MPTDAPWLTALDQARALPDAEQDHLSSDEQGEEALAKALLDAERRALERVAKVAENKIAEYEGEHQAARDSWGPAASQPYEGEIYALRYLIAEIRALAEEPKP